MGELLNKKYHLELEVLTPMHVGAGSEKDWMKGADFIQDKGKIFVLNQRKLLKKTTISANDLAGFLVKKDDQGLKNKISGSLADVSDLIFTAPVSIDNDIKVFIKNGLTNKPIIPGSSVKGAIRSILLEYFLNGNKPNHLIEKEIFGNSNKGDEFMRFVKISDADFDKTELINTKIFNLYGTAPNLNGGWKHAFKGDRATTSEFKQTGFNTIYEVLPQGEVGKLTIALADKAYENLLNSNVQLSYNDKEKKKSIVSENIQKKLFAIINDHTRKYIDKQITFFKKYSNNETVKIIENLTRIKEQIPDHNTSCVLKMSAGSGFHSITGDWKFDDFSVDRIEYNKGRNIAKKNGRKTAKSRKIAVEDDNFYLMGFIKLSVLDEDTLAKREAEKNAKLEKERRAEEEKIAREKVQQKRLDEEQRAKKAAERKAEAERIAKVKAEKEAREQLLQQKQEKEKEILEANKEKLERGLPVLEQETNYYSGKSFIVKYKKKNKIDENGVTYIKSFVEKFFVATHKEWKNFKRGKRWKEISGWVGKQTAQQWYDELMK